MRRWPVLLFLLAPGLRADEGERPIMFFRSPDPKTEKRIKNYLISNKMLGSGTRDVRTGARAELKGIGPWTVPYLAAAIRGKKREGVRIRMNAVMVLARIRDPRCLEALRYAAESDPDAEVRKTACLALGLFHQPEDRGLLFALLRDRDLNRKQQRAAALALAKLRDRDAAAILRANAHTPSRDPYIAASTLLAAAIASPKTECHRFLAAKKKLVRYAATTGLVIRPLAGAEAQPLLDLLRRPERDKNLRALQYHALGAIRERTGEIRKVLLKCVTSHSEKNEARIAALAWLSYEWGMTSNYAVLSRAYGRLRGRNDPVTASLLFALSRTDEPKAVDILLKVLDTASPFLRFYAAGSLLHWVVFRPDPHQREGAILEKIASLRAKDARLQELVQLARAISRERDATKRVERAVEGFKTVGDPRRLHLFDWTRTHRAWSLVNDLLPAIFDLDDVADKGAGIPAPPGGNGPNPGPGPGPRKVSATPEEQDLLDFLGEEPYFGPKDLGG